VTVITPADPAVPDRPDPEHQAAAGLAGWLREDRAAAEEHEEAMRAGLHRHEMLQRREAADRAFEAARTRVSGLIDRHNLDGRRTLAFWLGAAIVTCLVVLDAIPLNWAAQAFGLDAADSWVVTLILLAASIGAMAALEATRRDSRRYAALVGIMLVAYAGLVALRTSFLITVAGDSTAAALLQAVVLSAISAGLVFLGSAVMARTRPLRLSRAQAAARRAWRASQVAESACRQADDRLERHLGVLYRQLIRHPLYSTVPPGMTHSEWLALLKRVLRAQFAEQ